MAIRICTRLSMVVVSLSMITVLGLVGCGDGENSGKTNDPTNSGKPPETEEEFIAELKKYHGHAVRSQAADKPVETIWFKGPKATDGGLVYVKNFPQLKYLQLLYLNKFTDDGMAHIAGLTNLVSLEIDGPAITDTGLEHLQGLSGLKKLSLSFNDITDAGLVHLQGLTNLKHLALDDTKVTEKGVSELKQALPECNILTNYDNTVAVDTNNTTPDVKANNEPAEQTKSVARGGSDWPQWRGPNQDGICRETGLLQEWDSDGPPLKWESKQEIGGGHSSVVIENGKLFTTGRRDKTSFLIAFDTETGDKLWKTLIAEDNKTIYSTPTADGRYVYALGHEGDLICVEASDGTEVWRRNFIKDFGGDYQSRGIGGGYSESVLIDGDRLICTPGAKDAMMVGLDKMSGETIWKAAYPEDVGPQGVDVAGFSTAVISNACGMKQYVQLAGRGLISVAADDGRTLWTYNGIANNFYNISTPIVQGDYVFASTAHAGNPDAGTALLKLVPDNGGIKAELVYRLDKRIVANHHGGMVLVGDYIYMGHGYNRGFPLCLEMKTGRVAWRPGRGPGSGSAAVLYADGHIYFRYENGVMALVEANPAAYLLKGKFRSKSDDAREWSHPVISDGCLFVRGKSWLRCYDLSRP